MTNTTITQMKKADPVWFAKDAMKFFNSKIEVRPNSYNYFITSEQMDESQPRAYTVRLWNVDTQKVNTMDEFMGYATLQEAKDRKRELSQ